MKKYLMMCMLMLSSLIAYADDNSNPEMEEYKKQMRQDRDDFRSKMNKDREEYQSKMI